MPLRLTLQKTSPECEAPDHHFLFDGSLGEVIAEEEPSRTGPYDAEASTTRLMTLIKDLAQPPKVEPPLFRFEDVFPLFPKKPKT